MSLAKSLWTVRVKVKHHVILAKIIAARQTLVQLMSELRHVVLPRVACGVGRLVVQRDKWL